MSAVRMSSETADLLLSRTGGSLIASLGEILLVSARFGVAGVGFLWAETAQRISDAKLSYAALRSLTPPLTPPYAPLRSLLGPIIRG